MKNMRRILFRVGAVVILAAISVTMMFIGRGHTVYLDNKTIEYNGQTYEAPYKIAVTVGGEKLAKLYDDERGMSTCIGQKFTMTLEITEKKGGDEVVSTYTVNLPHNLDGIAINLPAYLAGLPEEAYLSEFEVILPEESVSPDATALPEGDLGMDVMGDI